MSQDDFKTWVHGWSTPMVLTDDLKSDLIENFEDAYNTAFNKGEEQGKSTVLREILGSDNVTLIKKKP